MARKPRAKTKTRRPSRGGGRKRAAETPHQKRVRKYFEKHPEERGKPGAGARARGHLPREHAERERKAIAAGLLTEKQRAAIKRYALKQGPRRGKSVDQVYSETLAWAQQEGYPAFEDMREVIKTLRLRRRQGKTGAYHMRGKGKKRRAVFFGDLDALNENLAMMDAAVDRLNLPDRDWIFYD
ncbi:MAG: hypothetical protein C5B60_01805 [Chloroflexi bacterium]|nr:MAG: hypothetical protein C5B60_01805 [Chloroflexota bacterium]